MPQLRRRYARMGRWGLILASSTLYLCLLGANALTQFSAGAGMSFFNLARFGFSAFTALVYLAVGSLVWLFARERRVAHLLLLFSLAMVVIFANETVHNLSGSLLATATGISGVVALTAFALLLLVFPYNYRTDLRGRRQAKLGWRRRLRQWLLKAYIVAHIALASLVVAYAVSKNLLALAPPAWLSLMVNFYYVGALVCILLTIIGAYCFASELRIRQQLRLFVAGVVLAFAPPLFLTVLPLALGVPTHYVIDGQLSSLPLLLLPLALGYAILRYQVLVFDRYIRRAVAWAVGMIGLAVLCYLVILLSRLVFSDPGLRAEQVICVTLFMAVLGPTTWWLAHTLTERLFFPEIRYYKRHMQRPELLTRETFDLNKASELLVLATMQAFETQEVCFYILDERTGYYHLAPPQETYRNQGMVRGQLLWQLADFAQLFRQGKVDVMDAQHAALQRLATAPRPLFLREALDESSQGASGLHRYLVTSPHERFNPLLIPVRAQGRMIGVLCLGERGDGQGYAGPDFEVLHLLLSHFSSVLETARLYVQASRHMAMLNALYSARTRLERAYTSIEEVAVAYASVAAEAMQGAAEIWLYVPESAVLHRVVHAGQGPSLLEVTWINQLQEQDWSACFREGANQLGSSGRPGTIPTCLEHLSEEPFAWLPLCKGQRRMGVLLCSFPTPHVFSVEEKRILGMFARQCAAAMENAQITIALRAAYDHQKELDQLKDQFIMTASHELRTPLTAVQGYIELLSQYGDELSAEMRSEFILKANRGCEELALMVGNIMDVSRLQTETERIHLAPVELIVSIQHVLEIVEVVTTREQRHVEIEVPARLYVQADDQRLRQVLLNLLSNALKYSAPGTAVQFQAMQTQDLVRVSIRDYGLGVPLEEQERLFERFNRLERDINSPVRGAGLGLYISKRLVEAMGGRLWIESSGVAGEGSLFAFTLQRAGIYPSVRDDVPLLARHRG